MRRHSSIGVCLLVLSATLSAQNCGWNGGQIRLDSDPQALGKTVSYRLSGLPGQPYFLFLSDAAAVTPVAPVGVACLDLTSPGFQLFVQGAIPASGTASFPIGIPNDPALLTAPPLFIQGLAGDPGAPAATALSQGLRVKFHTADTYEVAPALATPRALATATRAGDGRVLLTGGGNGTVTMPVGTASTVLYDPFEGTMTAGPAMSVARSLHTATALNDGRILIVGGVIDALGTAGTQCEIFDPLTGSFSPAASMGTARAAHAAELLADGRVLVVGGTNSFAGGSTSIGAVLNASSDMGEVYDPIANTWTPVANAMSSRRFLPTATRMGNGQVLVVSGLSGASNVFGQDVPTWTSSVDAYDPSLNRFVPVAGIGSANARGGASAARLPNGDIWVVGGAVAGFLLPVPTATTSTRIFRNGTWLAGPSLPEAAVLPPVTTLNDGSVFVAGGIGGTLTAPTAVQGAGRHDGTTFTIASGLPIARGGHALAALLDGGVLIAGGADASAQASSDAWVFTPNL